MSMRIDKVVISKFAGRKALTLLLALALVSALAPAFRTRADQSAALNKMSPALQQALTSNQSLVWHDPSKQTVRALIQTYGPVSSSFLKAINAAGGTVVRQFTSINGVLVVLPISQLLTFAARTDVERLSADHLAQETASHLEVATGADTVRTYNSLLGSFSGLDGSGIGIAILDSGIMAGHSEFGSLGNLLNLSRVTAKTDIISTNMTASPQ